MCQWRKKAGVGVNDILSVLQGYIGGIYTANFSRFGKQYRVFVQSLPEDRVNKASLNSMFVRTSEGEMAPVSQFVSLNRIYGPQTISRFNLFNAVSLNGTAAPGYSSGGTIDAIRRTASKVLPQGYDIAFSGLTREEIASGGQAGIIFMLSIVFVYFLLAAQYESYLLPFSVILSLPIGVAGAYIATWMAGLQNNIYFQIALIMLIGLLAKNAILIVEFARQRRYEGLSITEAALDGAKVRLRPILMTSFAFILGLLPLVLANGVGAQGNRSIGTGAAGGLLVGTIFGLFVIPVLFIIFQWLQERIGKKPDAVISKMIQQIRTMTSSYLKILITGLAFLSLQSCFVARTYEQPEVVREEYYRTDAFPQDSLNMAEVSWRNMFNDPQLQQYIEEGLEQNIDIRVAIQQVLVAEAYVKQGKAGYLPTLNAKGQYTHQELSANSQFGGLFFSRPV